MRSRDARVARIVTGGQTGADRAATDVAVALHVAMGGWVPKGGWAEDLPDPPGLLALYAGFTESESSDPAVRTALNVAEADATLLFVVGGVASPGSDLTRAAAGAQASALVEVDPTAPGAGALVRTATEGLVGVALNVAGPRESECPGIYVAVRAVLLACADTLFGCADD
jgi:hypothetical protein